MSRGLYLKYDSWSGSGDRFKISSYRFDGFREVNAHNKDAGDNMHFALECKCGSNDWTDNGRFINEYECNGCGQFVEVFPLIGEDNE